MLKKWTYLNLAFLSRAVREAVLVKAMWGEGGQETDNSRVKRW